MMAIVRDALSVLPPTPFTVTLTMYYSGCE